MEKLTLTELREFAKKRGIKRYSSMKKDELISVLSSQKLSSPKNKWIIKDKLSGGLYGEVYNVCLGSKCSYVVKKVKLGNVEIMGDSMSDIKNVTHEVFQKEVKIQCIASSHNIAPNIYDVWIDDEYGYIVMDKMDPDNMDELSEDVATKQAKQIINHIKNLHKLDIYHRDLRLDNIMTKNNDAFIIDFGESGYLSELTPNEQLIYKINDYWHLLKILSDYSADDEIPKIEKLVKSLMTKVKHKHDPKYSELLDEINDMLESVEESD